MTLLLILGVLVLAGILFALFARYISHWLGLFLPEGGKLGKPLRAAAAVVLALITVCFFATPGLVLLHFWLLSLMTEGVLHFLPRLSYRKTVQLAVPGLLLAVLLGWGVYNIAHPVQTRYTYETELVSRPYRVAILTDIHYDTIQNPAVLEKTIPQINALHPDMTILGGDIVEEGTSKARMEEVFSRLSALESPMGIYYVYGNHDQQNYSRHPAYTRQELADAITGSGIALLCDKAVELEELVIAGRGDLSTPDQRGELTAFLAPSDKLTIVVDHQPNRWKEVAQAGGDIQISGHTHAGQIFPVGQLLELAGGLSYGEYHRDGIAEYVSSGFAGWGYTIRTSERSEYVILDIVPKE